MHDDNDNNSNDRCESLSNNINCLFTGMDRAGHCYSQSMEVQKQFRLHFGIQMNYQCYRSVTNQDFDVVEFHVDVLVAAVHAGSYYEFFYRKVYS